VVAVGDAAHTGPPDGMGLNMAFEDVAVLAAEIKRGGGRVTSEVGGLGPGGRGLRRVWASTLLRWEAGSRGAEASMGAIASTGVPAHPTRCVLLQSLLLAGCP
jgi:hypothetical protein